VDNRKYVITAGHVCLDIHVKGNVPGPGQLEVIGPAGFSTGGAVANTGIACAKFGLPTMLMGLIGQDYFGDILQSVLSQSLPENGMLQMAVSPEATTSFSMVLNRPAEDRAFEHHPGANDRFGANDILYEAVDQARIFHFGYPPLMRLMYADNGIALASIFKEVRRRGALTSLDLVKVNPESEAARADWSLILQRVLPSVSLFAPSIGEVLDLVPEFRGLEENNPCYWARIASTFIEWGAGAVLLKLGAMGLYLRTATTFLGLSGDDTWSDREIIGLPFQENVFAGTTGAGDSAIAGFLAAMYYNVDPLFCVRFANAAGSCCIEAADATSGLQSWDQINSRIEAGWANLEPRADLSEWAQIKSGLYVPAP